MTISKDFRFPVSVHWQGQQLVHVEAPDVDEIVVAVPPEFRGPGGHWSPEQLFVGAAASCYAVTFAALAARELPIHALPSPAPAMSATVTTGEWGSSPSS
jgi:organic hydroperoxide reductase OsmC/OhrA